MMDNPSESLMRDRLEKRFAKWDTNGNGRLELQDLETEAVNIGRAFGKPADAAETVAVKDAFTQMYRYLAEQSTGGPDGPISREQFTDAAGQMIQQGGPPAFDQVLGPLVHGIIGMCDHDGDYMINAEEFGHWLSSMDVDRQEALAAFDRIDRDGGGRLSQDELLTAVRDYHFGWSEIELLG